MAVREPPLQRWAQHEGEAQPLRSHLAGFILDEAHSWYGLLGANVRAMIDRLRLSMDVLGCKRPSFEEHAMAAYARLEERPNTVVKLLATLHAKVVIVDERILYCGSANWYRYSLEESREIVLRDRPAAALPLKTHQPVGSPTRHFT